MLKLGLHVPEYPAPTIGGNEWDGVVAQALAAEEAGFDSLLLPDHFMWVRGDPFDPDPAPMLELYTTLGGLAAVTSRIKLGALVAGAPYRNAALHAKMAATLDVMSHGRAIFGIGAAWAQHEFDAYGWPFEPTPKRMRRLAEAVQVALTLWTQRPANFDGRYYQLRNALCDPPCVQRPHVPILIGGGGERTTLRLAARYANLCNVFGSPEEVAHKYAVLRRHCAEVGRPYDAIQKTNTLAVLVGRDQGDLERKMPRFEAVASGPSTVVGTPDQVIARLREYERAGSDQVICLILDGYDVAPIRLFGETVLPSVADRR